MNLMDGNESKTGLRNGADRQQYGENEGSQTHQAPTPELVLLPADGVDSEGVRVLIAGGDDSTGQGQHAAGLLGARLLIDKVLQQSRLIV